MQASVVEAVPRSQFVSVVAWIFIVLSGMTTFIALLQNIMFALFFSDSKIEDAMRTAPTQPPLPPFFHAIFEHMQVFVIGFFVVSATTLVASIGLLHRKN